LPTIDFSHAQAPAGTSVRVHTVISPHGGVFSVFVDGFNTSTTIDTFLSPNSSSPLCYPAQFPPFVDPPPDLATRNDHTITLVYMGPSPQASNSSQLSEGRFDSFAIPQFSAVTAVNGCHSLTEGIKTTSRTSAIMTIIAYATFGILEL
jgi:hypothetical protein